MTLGCIQYFMRSLATSTFFAPFGMKPPPAPTWAAIGWPSLPLGRPVVTTSCIYACVSLIIASSVEIVPSKSTTNTFSWKALLSSASFQLNASGGT